MCLLLFNDATSDVRVLTMKKADNNLLDKGKVVLMHTTKAYVTVKTQTHSLLTPERKSSPSGPGHFTPWERAPVPNE